MKRRVRGLLHHKWLRPLGAVVLASLPTLLTLALVVWLTLSSASGSPSLYAQIAGFVEQKGSAMTITGLKTGAITLDYAWLISVLPGLAVLVGVYVFVSMPVSVSTSGYFLGFLRGKARKEWEVFSCFSGRYPRALGGMLYRLLWAVLWALAAFAVPLGIYIGGEYLTAVVFAERLGGYQLWVTGGLIAFCVLWLVIFTLLFINRLLAYSLTPVCISAQPRLPAYRAVRLSRKLMRGCKWRLISQTLSFLTYYIPTLLAGALLIAMRYVESLLALSDLMEKALRVTLLAAIGVNQLVIVYTAPYMAACFRAFYIERKREALMDEEVTPDDFAPKQRAEYRVPEDTPSGSRQRRRKGDGPGKEGSKDEHEQFEQ